MAEMKFQPVEELKVSIIFDQEPISVGRMAVRNNKIYFEYDSSFLELGLEISPLKLPLQNGLIQFDKEPFEGLAGVFNDSLPDGWGRLLLDRFLKSKGILPNSLSALDRLAYTGSSGIGALIYQPEHNIKNGQESEVNLDLLSQQSKEVLKGNPSDVIQELIELNGSSAGARPKALIGLNKKKKQLVSNQRELPKGFEHWIVKFPNSTDGNDAGAIEYVYALMANQAGIEMMPVHLFESKLSPGYFAIKRFDRIENLRLHVHSVSGLLHNNFRLPSLDYTDLMNLTAHLTGDVREVEKMYRLAVFNVLAHNRDDHSKNFSFLMDKQGFWKLSPAYDLTFSSGPGGQQSTMLMGEGQYPKIMHLQALGKEADLSNDKVKKIISQTTAALSQWEILAKTHNVDAYNIILIKKHINGLINS